MANIIWNKFSEKEKKEYIEFLKIFGALSGLFKDNQEGANARKPYLYYRNHEQLFARVFDVEDLTRKDSAFDALGAWKNYRVGIGLKTWIHTKDKTYQKVAEFNKLAPEVLAPLIKNGKSYEVIRKVSELRNERIMLDKRLYKTDRDVYHYVTRDNDVMNIIETPYELIDIESLELISDGKTYTFKDKLHNYKFYTSKSVLLEEFDASNGEIIEQIPIEQFDDPFELIRMINLSNENFKVADEGDAYEVSHEEIILPLYQDKKEGPFVSDCSGVNIRHGKSKNKGSNTPRPEYEIEVRISIWVHHIFPRFFGINALNDNDVKDKDLNDFDLILPDGRVLRGRVKQENGKSLQTNPQGALGEWILKDVLGLENREVVTMEYLDSLGIDSLRIIKLDDKHFKITVAETGAYERFKLDNRAKMNDVGLNGRQLPYFRPELVQELELLDK
ncbi:NgoFVII family restriction endonuclease [Terrisporobacter petrolearius]|uniref:NgoFVII family restriction endonuclease n=1 Tax=Terrisporobacter petrolearius TaxID=1460447 RepID=UPI001D1608F0|nr:NgoFVII family restriction endonuclease [Terrisporobacter petrolearius]MCC3863898.1 NgoFVII family restriction endonuclease [Terrisporobacter petrolearius]